MSWGGAVNVRISGSSGGFGARRCVVSEFPCVRAEIHNTVESGIRAFMKVRPGVGGAVPRLFALAKVSNQKRYWRRII